MLLRGHRIKRAILSLLAAATALICLEYARAAPPQQVPGANISSPRDNAVVRGQVVIQGTANIPDFWKYEVHYAPEPATGNQWIPISGVVETPVVEGILAVWDTTTVPDGSYSLRLRVARKDGNYVEVFVRGITVANTKPTETPTPEARTPTPTPTPIPPTPTIVIQVPISPTPRPTFTALPTPVPSPTPQISFDLGSLGAAFCYGAGGAAAAFAFVGVLYLIRGLISYILSKIG